MRLVFDRQESGDCTSRVVFTDLGVSADLPAFADTAVELAAQPPGTYGFACGMNMIHGLLDVADEPAGDVAPPPAEETQRAVDQEVTRLLQEAEVRATELLGTHRDTLERGHRPAARTRDYRRLGPSGHRRDA